MISRCSNHTPSCLYSFRWLLLTVMSQETVTWWNFLQVRVDRHTISFVQSNREKGWECLLTNIVMRWATLLSVWEVLWIMKCIYEYVQFGIWIEYIFEICPTFTRACISRACGGFMVLSAVRHRNLSPLAGHQMTAGNEAQQQQTWVRFTEVVTCAATGREIHLILMTSVNLISKPIALYIQSGTNTERKPLHTFTWECRVHWFMYMGQWQDDGV